MYGLLILAGNFECYTLLKFLFNRKKMGMRAIRMFEPLHV
jgi:hypothetical protein